LIPRAPTTQQRASDTANRHGAEIGLDQRLHQKDREQHVVSQPFQPLPLRLGPYQGPLQDEAEHDQQKHRQQRRDDDGHCSAIPAQL
jgi:hypothetical protein